MLGEVLGNYRVTAALDAGGMGSVYRAEHTHLGRPAAIKLLHPELTTNAEIVQRFFNEAKAATAIRHPGIVDVYDFGYTADGRAYFVMELLVGEPLSRRRTGAGGRLAEREAARIGKDIASVLKAAHAIGIVHRDLKPDNVFLIPDDDGARIKVLDFGVAKLADVFPAETRHTQTGALMGTPVYMAPEQARSAAEIDHRADLYSLGCILYELLAGVPPFTGEGAGEIIALQMFSPPQPLRDRLDAVTPELEAIVMKLLEKEPADRFASAAELSAALGGVLPALRDTLAAERRDADLAAPRFTYTPGSQQLPRVRESEPQFAGRVAATRSDEPRFASGESNDIAPRERAYVRQEPRKRPLLPLVAIATTVVLAGGAALFALTRPDDDAPAAPATPAATTAAPVPVAPPPTPPTPPTTHTEATGSAAPVAAGSAEPKPTRRAVKRRPVAAPDGVPVTRPDVEPLQPAAELRTPLTNKPLEEVVE